MEGYQPPCAGRSRALLGRYTSAPPTPAAVVGERMDGSNDNGNRKTGRAEFKKTREEAGGETGRSVGGGRRVCDRRAHGGTRGKPWPAVATPQEYQLVSEPPTRRST